MTAAELVHCLIRRRETLALAESCTGGLVLAALTEVAGASTCIWGGAVVYTEHAKRLLVGIDEGLLAEHGPVSPELTAALARGIRRCGGTTWGAAVTGWAGPDTDGPDPVGTVYLAVAGEGTGIVDRRRFPGARAAIRHSAACALIDEIGVIVSAGTGNEDGR